MGQYKRQPSLIASDFSVAFHVHDIRSAALHECSETISINETVCHPDYDESTFDNDICILKLAYDARCAQLMDLPQIDLGLASHTGETATAAGWGKTSDNSATVVRLRSVTLPIVNNSLCESLLKSSLPRWMGRVTEGMMCAGHIEGGADTCGGDSGGPLFRAANRRGGRPLLIGLTSWGFGCARASLPGVYARVSHYSDWIHSHILHRAAPPAPPALPAEPPEPPFQPPFVPAPRPVPTEDGLTHAKMISVWVLLSLLILLVASLLSIHWRLGKAKGMRTGTQGEGAGEKFPSAPSSAKGGGAVAIARNHSGTAVVIVGCNIGA